MLNIIGIGLDDEKDITLKGLEIVRKSDRVYLETYTSKLQCSLKELEKLYKKKIIPANRELVENNAEQTILKEAKTKEVSLLVIGDPTCATTHTDIILRAKKLGIKTKIIHNASIISAVGITGLEVYKFGKTTSIPFENKDVKTPFDVLKNNLKNNLHTLILLDLKPDENKFLTISEAINYLAKQGMSKSQLCIGCARLGSDTQKIIAASADKLAKIDFGNPTYCLVIPAKLHFIEEEALEQWKI